MFQVPGIGGAEQVINLTLFTDAFVVRGTITTRQRRITDLLNDAEHNFLVLTDVTMDEFGSRSIAARSEYVQVNLDTVLFAVAETSVEPVPELRTPKIAEQAMISIPPFRVVGRIHLLPERDLRSALEELTGRFLPVTDAYYWSDTVGEARTSAPMVAVNHSRAQILAPHHEVDPWAGLGATDEASRPAGEEGRAPDAIGQIPGDAASTSTPTGSQDPWGAGTGGGGTSGGGTPDTGIQDPWGFERRGSEAGEAPSNPWGGPGGDPWGTSRRREDESSG
jgi:hypothetical protein